MLNAATVEGVMMGVTAFILIAPMLLVALVFFIPMCPSPSDCDTYWGQFPFAFLYWLCIPLTFLVIAMLVVMSESREYFSEHFEEYKCKPWFIPFVSYVRPDVSVQDNFTECTAAFSTATYAMMSGPLIQASAGLSGGIGTAHDTVAKIQNDQMQMAAEVGRSFERRHAEASKYAHMSTYVFLKVQALFDKLTATVYDVYYALASMMDLLTIAMNGPELMIKALGIYTGGALALSVGMAVYAFSMCAIPFNAVVCTLSVGVTAVAHAFYLLCLAFLTLLVTLAVLAGKQEPNKAYRVLSTSD
jgi:hypothetical protein